MTTNLSESSIVRVVAQQAATRLARKVIRDLQQMHQTLSGEGSELRTTWDEICVQVQGEQSYFWDTYDETARQLVSAYTDELAEHEREAIWLQTDAGFDWRFDDPEEREPYPVCDDDIIDHITRQHVYAVAERWSNVRIRAFIDRSMIRD